MHSSDSENIPRKITRLKIFADGENNVLLLTNGIQDN